MQKRGLLCLILGIFLISFVSAYSLSDLLGDIESSTVLLIAVFTISFAILNFALSKFFKDKYGEPNKAIVGIIAFVISFLITYGINKTGFDIEGLFFDIGISSELLYTIIPIIIIGGLILIIWKFGKKSLFILGGLLILLSFFIYEKTLILTLGIILLVVGIGLSFKKKGRINSQTSRTPRYASPRPSRTNHGPKISRMLGNQSPSPRKTRRRPNISFSSPRQEWVTEKKAQNNLRREQANVIARQEKEEARSQARRDAKQKRKEEKISARQTRQEQKEAQQKQVQAKQIGSNLKSLTKTYNEIQRTNPSDPRLIEIIKEIKRIRSQK